MKITYKVAIGLGVVLLAGFVYSFLLMGTDWQKETQGVNGSYFYEGQTNGVSNNILIKEARQYIQSNPPVELNGSTQRYLGETNIDPAWFGTHAPERITTAFNPISSAGAVKEVFVVHWFYLPGCEKRPEDTVSKPNWFTPEGKQCFGGKSVNVTLNESLLPEKLEISDLW